MKTDIRRALDEAKKAPDIMDKCVMVFFNASGELFLRAGGFRVRITTDEAHEIMMELGRWQKEMKAEERRKKDGR